MQQTENVIKDTNVARIQNALGITHPSTGPDVE